MPTSENDGRERLYARYRRDRLLGATARDGPQGAPVSLGRLAVRLVLGAQHALLPQPPDCPHQVAFEGPDRFALGLALAHPTHHVSLGGWPRAQLRQGDAVENGVELAVPAAIEPVAHPPPWNRASATS
jgi:hypothetical protein